MFSGIIEELGTIRHINRSSLSGSITIQTGIDLDQVQIGDSIAVNGACLTVTRKTSGNFEADISPETTDRTVLGELKPGDRVNLERALRLSDLINGHLVSGHIDGVGVITEKRNLGNAVIVTLKIPTGLSNYVIEKGSIAVDGVSLTINDCSQDSVTLSIIPLTAKETTIGFKEVGASVNLEVDMIAKYVERLLTNQLGESIPTEPSTSISREMLAKNGFI